MSVEFLGTDNALGVLIDASLIAKAGKGSPLSVESGGIKIGKISYQTKRDIKKVIDAVKEAVEQVSLKAIEMSKINLYEIITCLQHRAEEADKSGHKGSDQFGMNASLVSLVTEAMNKYKK